MDYIVSAIVTFLINSMQYIYKRQAHMISSTNHYNLTTNSTHALTPRMHTTLATTA